MLFFYKQHFYKQDQAEFGKKIKQKLSNTLKLSLAKNQAKAKQHTEAEFLLFENYSLSSSMLSSKTNIRYSKKNCKKTSVSVFIRLYV